MSILSGKTILVVDDEADLRDILVDELESHRAIVISAESGKQASQLLANRAVDLVISDIRMASGSGVDLLDLIKKKDHRKPQVVMVTGFSDLSAEEIYARGAAVIFIKPFDLGKLVGALELLMTPLEQRRSVKTANVLAKPAVLQFDNVDSVEQSGVFRLGQGGFFLDASHVHTKVDDVLKFKIEFKQAPDLSLEGIAACRWVRNEGSNFGVPGAGFEIIELTQSTIENFKKLSSRPLGSAFIPRG